MSLQDLTPQLRTRLNRVEHAVGIFVILALLILLGGFSYYIYFTAQKKGWFVLKAKFFTYVDSATGLSKGQPVKMMGFDVGEITHITAEAPGMEQNVYVEFIIKGEFIGYMWTDSKARLNAGDLLGNRQLEVLKGNWQGGWTNADGSTVQAIFKIDDKLKKITQVITNSAPGQWAYQDWNPKMKPYYMDILEDPALTERASSLVGMAESAMPNILSLTNQIQETLKTANAAMLSLDMRIKEFQPILTNANAIIAGFKPAATNISIITGNLTNENGGLGQWLLPTNLNQETELTLISLREAMNDSRATLTNATAALKGINTLVGNTDTNLMGVMASVGDSIDNLAMLTSNLNAQVESNTNLLGEISTIIRNTDEFVQGLKRHWMFRSLFKKAKD